MKNKKRAAAIFLSLGLLLSGCAGEKNDAENTVNNDEKTEISSDEREYPEFQIEGLKFEKPMDIKYAKSFRGAFYEDGFAALEMDDGRKYLVVPEGKAAPEGAAEFIILHKPLDGIYIAATSAMSFFDALGGLSAVRLSGTKQEGWYIEGAAAAMENGDMLYAGKYSAPDYELLLSEGCDLAIESTMIYDSPETWEKLEELGIPVMIDRSGSEDHPLGRTEWIKVYAALLGENELAKKLFDEQCAMVESLSDTEPTGKTVAFFYVKENGTVAVRALQDYIPAMIELGGGEYIFSELESTGSSVVTMTMEDFYASAKEADYIIYNATIDDPLDSVSELLEKSGLFEGFKAVKEGNVWSTGKYLFQASDELGSMIWDIKLMLSGEEDPAEYTFIHKLS
ncbi:MAG: ABC transporter substrate-binding protein [Firmicutes bacterium]|nr:ABC transporter substrate-binding protein [Bacillota bacterium]